LAIASVLLVGQGCNHPVSETGPGGSGGCDEKTIPAGASCAEIVALQTAWLDCNASCDQAGDCAIASLRQGNCLNPCPAVIGVAAKGSYLDRLQQALIDGHCGSAGCFCTSPSQAACSSAQVCSWVP
jgi:hypothetical protein